MLAGKVNLTKSLGIEFSPNNKFYFFARTKKMPKPRSESDKQFDDIAVRFAVAKPEPERKYNFEALKDTFQAFKKQTEKIVKEGIEMSKGKTAFTGKAKIIDKLVSMLESYSALMEKMKRMPSGKWNPEYDDWRFDNDWEFLSNIPYNWKEMVFKKAGIKEAKDEYSGT
jgi:hypothetical protein